MFTSKCASPDNGVHFFDISTSKSGPNVWCFSAFDHMLRHNGKNVENCGLGGVPFWRSGDTFSASQFPKVLRHWCFNMFQLFWHQNVLRATTEPPGAAGHGGAREGRERATTKGAAGASSTARGDETETDRQAISVWFDSLKNGEFSQYYRVWPTNCGGFNQLNIGLIINYNWWT